MKALSHSGKRSPRKRLGYEILQCQALWQWRGLQMHVIPELANLFHIPNEGRRTPAEASVLKSMGLRPGVWDYQLAHQQYYGGALRAGLWIEMKSPNGKLTEEQEEWGRLVRVGGYATKVAYSWLEARDAIITYLQPAHGTRAMWCQ